MSDFLKAVEHLQEGIRSGRNEIIQLRLALDTIYGLKNKKEKEDVHNSK
jgi:hypothetical protein